MNSINSWEVVGYVDPTLPAAKIVKPILRDPSNPDIYFYAENPEIDVRTEVEGMPKKDTEGRPYLGGGNFRLLDTPMKYSERNLYIRQFGQNNLLAVMVYLDDLTIFEKMNEVFNRKTK